MTTTEMTCPRCGSECGRDEADVGVGIMYGPWGCYCGWSEWERYDTTAGPRFEGGYLVDSRGGLTPIAPAETAVELQRMFDDSDDFREPR